MKGTLAGDTAHANGEENVCRGDSPAGANISFYFSNVNAASRISKASAVFRVTDRPG